MTSRPAPVAAATAAAAAIMPPAVVITPTDNDSDTDDMMEMDFGAIGGGETDSAKHNKIKVSFVDSGEESDATEGYTSEGEQKTALGMIFCLHW